MTHGTGHSGAAERNVQLFRRRRIAVEQEVAYSHLLHEGVLVGFQLLGCYRVLVRTRWADNERNHSQYSDEASASEDDSGSCAGFHDQSSVNTARSGRRSAAAGF